MCFNVIETALRQFSHPLCTSSLLNLSPFGLDELTLLHPVKPAPLEIDNMQVKNF